MMMLTYPVRVLLDRAGRGSALVKRRGIRILRTGGIRLVSAPGGIAGADMAAVASTVCVVNIRERLLRGNVGRVDAIAEEVVRRDIEP